jgi:hypothetical protein
LLSSGKVLADGNWLTLANPCEAAVQLMILMSDGTVLAANNPTASGGGAGFVWYRLTPDEYGHYVLGKWSDVAPMKDARLYYSSQLLPDGRLFVAGGEYGSGGAKAEIYDPAHDQWTQINPPVALLDPSQPSPYGGTQSFLDSASELLPDGSVLVNPVQPQTNYAQLIYYPQSNTWAQVSPPGFISEASWVKLPDNSILTVINNSTSSVRFIPSLNQWIPDAPLPVSIWQGLGTIYAGETGPAFLLPNGNAFFLGGSGHTAIYTPSGSTSAGSWVAGPDIPGGLGSADAPGAMMPNGKILCTASGPPFVVGTGKPNFPKPTYFFEYDYSAGPVGTFTPVNGPTGPTDDVPPFVTAMLVLPDGSVLYANSTEQNFPATGAKLYVYVPIGDPVAAGKPVISSITPNPDGSFHLTGAGLNGISEGAAYGEDAQMSSNYPIIKFTDNGNGHADYGRTYNWSSTGVMTRNQTVSTDFTLPAGLILQTYSLTVIANGISSDPVPFSFLTPSSLALCPGESGSLGTISAQPGDYQWLFNGVPLPGETNSVLRIVAATPSRTGLYALRLRASGTEVTSQPAPVSVGSWVRAQPHVTNAVELCQTASFSVTARGKEPLSIQWFRNGNLIVPDARITTSSAPASTGDTVFSLNLTEVHYQDDATYTAVITDACQTTASVLFTVRVIPNPPWVRVATAGPPSRNYSAMCYDADRRVTVLFGGCTYLNFPLSPSAFLGDTWEFDGTNWTQRLPANSPGARTMANMVYDSRRHRTVLFGGIRSGGLYQTQFTPETWEWDGTNWQQIVTAHLPPGDDNLDFYAACFDTVRGEMLLYGRLMQDPLWAYDGTDWRARNAGGTKPAYYQNPIMAFDTNRGVAVLLGAWASAVYNQPLWEWDGNAWHERPQSGQQPDLSVSDNAFTYDTFRQECVLFGMETGIVDGRSTSDLYPAPDLFRYVWRWNGAQWQADPPSPTLGVPFERGHSMCFDSARNALVLFGGYGEGNTNVVNYTYEILYQDAPAVLEQPTFQLARLGQVAQISVVAVGAPPIAYQWQKDGVNLADIGRLSGSTSDTLQLAVVEGGDSGTYCVVLSNRCGVAVSQPINLSVSTSPIAISRGAGSGTPLTIDWADPNAALQSAPSLGGPWTDVAGASSSYSPVVSGQQQQFFRIRN